MFKSIFHFITATVPAAIGIVEREVPAVELVLRDLASAGAALTFAYSAKGLSFTGDEAAVTAFIQVWRDVQNVASGTASAVARANNTK